MKFHDVYPGIDVVYYGTPSSLEYDLIAAPGADTSKITFAIEGPAKTTQTASGDILIETTSGTIKISKPLNYQRNADGSQTPVEGSFKLASDGTVQAGVPTRDVVIKLASYDRSRSLYIDPVVIPYSTYFGGHAQSVGPVNLEQFGSDCWKSQPESCGPGTRPRARQLIATEGIYHGRCLLDRSAHQECFSNHSERSQCDPESESKRLDRKIRHVAERRQFAGLLHLSWLGGRYQIRRPGKWRRRHWIRTRGRR